MTLLFAVYLDDVSVKLDNVHANCVVDEQASELHTCD